MAEQLTTVNAQKVTLMVTVTFTAPDVDCNGEVVDHIAEAEVVKEFLTCDLYLDDYIPPEATYNIEVSILGGEPTTMEVYREVVEETDEQTDDENS